ncbi:hypothetical protein [Ekhidna sp.]
MTKFLNVSNPNHFTFQYDSLELAILGGIRLEGLDRMRVTLKIQVKHLSLRHNLDLYNDNQVDKLIRKVAEKLEIGTSVTTKALAELTDALEQYRLEQIEALEEDSQEGITLTQGEEKKARLYLSSANLMQRTMEDIGAAGVIGEEINRLLMYIIFTSRKRENPLHIISLGSSGIGKTHLQEKVSALIPDEDKLEITALSGNAFYYFGRHELQNKLILIEDLDGAQDVLYPLREISSKKRISKTVVIKNTKGETRTITLKVEGPVCIAGCTTQESIYEDNANRSFLIYIDESEAQDEKIMDYQRKDSAGQINKKEQAEIIQQFQNMQRLLTPVSVRNPFASKLHLPKEVLKPRRTNAHYLAFIEAVTFYHQFQRDKKKDKQSGEEYIETTLEDIQEANKLLRGMLLRKSDELNGATRNYLEKLKDWLTKEDKSTFTNSEARQVLRVHPSNQKRYMVDLLGGQYIKRLNGNQATGYAYEVVSMEEYQKLQTDIDTVIDSVVSKLSKK